MFEVKLPGKAAARQSLPAWQWSESGQQPGHTCRIVAIFREKGGKILLFRTNYRNVDKQKHQGSNQRDPRTAGRGDESGRYEQRAQIERVARVSVRTSGSEFPIFSNVSRC